MAGDGCVAFLKDVLPNLGLAWPGFRRVHGQVCKRVKRRLRALGIADFAAYIAFLESNPSEWDVLQTLCHITISRFWRDRAVFDRLADVVVPHLAEAALVRGDTALRVWSAGCASGEEPYSIKLLWEYRVAPKYPGFALSVIATDTDPVSLQRAQEAVYRASSLKELPEGWAASAFRREGQLHRLRDALRADIEFCLEDIRTQVPKGPFDLILCRNLVFTYFDRTSRDAALEHIVSVLRQGGVLVVGHAEQLPRHDTALEPWVPDLGIYRKRRG